MIVGLELTRKLTCPACHNFVWHDSLIGQVQEENKCRHCQNVWAVHYDSPSRLYDQLMQTQIDRIRSSINDALGRVVTHSWSKNLGKRDCEALELLRHDLEHAIALVDTFVGK